MNNENVHHVTNTDGVTVWYHQHGIANGKRVSKCEASMVEDLPCLDGWYWKDEISKNISGPFLSMHEAFHYSKRS